MGMSGPSLLIESTDPMISGAHNEERKGRGKESEAPTHLIEFSDLTNAAWTHY